MDKEADQPNSSPKPSSKKQCKIAFLGGAGVGKTSLINRFMYDQFTRNYETTVGIDYFTKSMNIDEITLNLQIWDTAGQEQYNSLIPTYIRDAGAVIIVYDVSDQKSLESARKWYDNAQSIRGDDFQCVLAGNKTDLQSNVDEQAVKSFAEEKSIQHVLVSAKTGDNVTDLFMMAAREALKRDAVAKTVQVVNAPEKEISNKSGGCSC